MMVIIVVFSLGSMSVVYADTTTPAFVSGTNVNVRTNAGTNYPNVKTVTGDNILLLNGHDLTILNIANSPKDSSGYTWYNISFTLDGKQYTGYMRSDYITLKVTYNPEPQNDYERELQSKGFPYTYWPQLSILHQKYPNWQFIAVNTNLDWNTAVREESYVGKSLIQGNEGYRSTADGSYDWLNNKWFIKEGSNWYAANSQTVAYYMDPRNFLDETRIFMFQDLTYNSNYITPSTIDMVFSGSYSYLKPYSSNFVQAGVDSGVNPVYLAVLARQELGGNGSVAVSGQNFCYPDNNQKYASEEKGKCYSGYYNFFNIGAGTDAAPIYNSLIYAKNNGWNTPQAAVTGGANFIGSSYIKKGQYTSYFKKYNVSPTSSNSLYTHQYMTNVQAPYSEASTAYSTYRDFGIINEPLVFAIPIFNNMPEKVTLPPTGNPNNLLKSLKVNNTPVQNFDPWTSSYDFYVTRAASSVDIIAEGIVSNNITNTGKINLTGDITTINIKVTAGNGDVRTYTIRVIKTDGVPISIDDIINGLGFRSENNYLSKLSIGMDSGFIVSRVKEIGGQVANVTIKTAAGTAKSGSIVTGDVITIKGNNQEKNYTAVIYGDCSGDGAITIRDLLQVQKHILDKTGSDKLVGAYYKAGDVDRDGNITIRDLLQVQQHILKYSNIQQ